MGLSKERWTALHRSSLSVKSNIGTVHQTVVWEWCIVFLSLLATTTSGKWAAVSMRGWMTTGSQWKDSLQQTCHYVALIVIAAHVSEEPKFLRGTKNTRHVSLLNLVLFSKQETAVSQSPPYPYAKQRLAILVRTCRYFCLIAHTWVFPIYYSCFQYKFQLLDVLGLFCSLFVDVYLRSFLHKEATCSRCVRLKN